MQQRHWSDDPLTDLSYQLHGQLFGSFTGHIINTFVEIRIADVLHGGPMSISELCAVLGADPVNLSSFLSVCANLDLVQAGEDDTVRLTERGRLLRFNAFDAKFAQFLTAPGTNRMYEQLPSLVLSGAPARGPSGRNLYQHFEEDLTAGEAFQDVMTELSGGCVEGLLAAYDFSRHRKIVDLGGGKGVLLSSILHHTPGPDGLLYETPSVIEMARASIEPTISRRIEFVAGSFLEKVPADGDLYLLKSIFCDWGDHEVGRILRNCYRAVPEGTALLVIDWFGPDRSPTELSSDESIFRNLFLRTLFGGRVRSQREFRTALTGAGFRIDQVIPEFSAGSAFGPPSPWNLIVARR
ncbi:methyltransferase [Amycolatopsis silviterrae]|uniref:Methyltransferase n=1 Tax=Amycolatopsis silviterrae TaxID=1656914 RepID=A0ABW5H6F8_9PSEU